uniref:Uncharacterized protein n=1 Tax=Triticum urartu TaxID=4572 RepID=A0A8R7RC95_TRIUA
MFPDGLLINGKVPILEAPHKLVTLLYPLHLAYCINQTHKRCSIRGMPSLEHLHTESNSLIQSVALAQTLYNQPVAEGIWNDPVALHLPEDPDGIVQLGCFAEGLDNSGVDDHLWDGALLAHQTKQLHGLRYQSVLAEAVEHGDGVGYQPRLFHLPEDVVHVLRLQWRPRFVVRLPRGGGGVAQLKLLHQRLPDGFLSAPFRTLLLPGGASEDVSREGAGGGGVRGSPCASRRWGQGVVLWVRPEVEGAEEGLVLLLIPCLVDHPAATVTGGVRPPDARFSTQQEEAAEAA